METFLALAAAFGIVAALYYLFGAIFLRSAAGRVTVLVEARTDRDLTSLLDAWISSFLSGAEVLVLPEDRNKTGKLLSELFAKEKCVKVEKRNGL